MIFGELMKEQKDVGKLKGMNVKLKEEMTSLRAMLAAQAKGSAASIEHEKALGEKQKTIEELEKRIAEIEKELAEAKQKVQQLESDLINQQNDSSKDKEQLQHIQDRRSSRKTLNAPESPRGGHKKTQSTEGFFARRRPSNDGTTPASVGSDHVSPEVLAAQRVKVAILEEELDSERRLRREADGEIIKLRAAANGVKLDAEMVNDLLAPQHDFSRSEDSSFAGDESPIKARYVLVARFPD
jgi:uncharacterized coiled-coil protein SlyX